MADIGFSQVDRGIAVKKNAERLNGDLSAHSNSSTLQQIVRGLRVDSLKSVEGALIGSEDQLLARHGVSRPTLRKAAALVAQEQLLEVRRGVGGGYIARRPTSRAVAHMASIYLSSHHVDLGAVLNSTNPIRAELARLAAENLNPESLQTLQDFLKRDVASNDSGEIIEFGRREREFGRVLGAASGNAVLSLFLQIVYDLVSNIERERDILINRPDRIATYRKQRRRLVEAILDGEADLAVLLSHRVSNLHKQWMLEDDEQASKRNSALAIPESAASNSQMSA